MRNQTSIHFSILVVQGAVPSGVAVTTDILKTARQLLLTAKGAMVSWTLYSAEGGIVMLQGGLMVETEKLPKNSRALSGSVLVIPGAGMSSQSQVTDRIESSEIKQIMDVVKLHSERGGICAAACSSVFILQAAGVLAKRTVTTTWWLGPHLQKLEPSCQVKTGSIVCDSGNVITAGAALAQSDLMLYFLRKLFSQELARQVARFLLLDGDRAQSEFILPGILTAGDLLASRFQYQVEATFPDSTSVRQIAKELALTERTLHRQLKQTTGMTPNELIQLIRFHRAQTLLASGEWSIEEVANRVGYQDTTALRRLMKKIGGRSPIAFKA